MKRLEAVSGSINFVNFNEISRGLSPLRPAAAECKAARIVLSRVAHFIDSGATFTMETTLSGKAQMHLLRQAHEAGVATSLLYFSARSPEICLERIARRVAEGGHDVPEDVVRRRFVRALPTCPAISRSPTSGASTRRAALRRRSRATAPASPTATRISSAEQTLR
jgi:predicted ABC-type ATPase